MSIIRKLATSLDRRDEGPNVELAALIARKEDKLSVSELVSNLNNKNKGIRHDCIKVLYEVGKLKPRLIADSYRLFIALLGNQDNRLQWGAMTALETVTQEKPREIFMSLGKIIDAANKGSVITRDHCVKILIKLASIERYNDRVFPFLVEQLETCPVNQLPMYAEKALPAINDRNRDDFLDVLKSRVEGVEQETRRKRIETVIKKLSV